MYVELDRLANLIGDAHTYIEIPSNAPRFPLAIRGFGTEYRVVAVRPGSERILGLRLLRVEDTPTPLAIQRLWPLTPADKNASLRQARTKGFLGSSVILHGVGLTSVRSRGSLPRSSSITERCLECSPWCRWFGVPAEP